MRLLVFTIALVALISARAQEGDPTLQPAPTFPGETSISVPAAVVPPDENMEGSPSSFPYTAPAQSNLTPQSVTQDVVPPGPSSGFVKPPGPKAGGVRVMPHPNAPKGLLRINKDGTYQYKTPKIVKTRAVSVKIGSGTPPKIKGPEGSKITFASMYGNNTYTTLNIDYEWQAFKSFGSLGFQAGSGLTIMQGQGTLQSGGQALEKFTLVALPASAFLIYRLEFSRKQWFVPYLLGGGTVFGLIERRDDGKRTNFAMAPAAGGAVGAHFALSGVDDKSAFILSEDYGIADMWVTVEGRVLQGLRAEVDFTTFQLTAGVTMDF